VERRSLIGVTAVANKGNLHAFQYPPSGGTGTPSNSHLSWVAAFGYILALQSLEYCKELPDLFMQS